MAERAEGANIEIFRSTTDGHADSTSSVDPTTSTVHCQRAADPPSTASANASVAQQTQYLPDILDRLTLVPNRPSIQLPPEDYPNPFQLPETRVSNGPPVSVAIEVPAAVGGSRRYLTVPSAQSSSVPDGVALRDQLFGPCCSGCSAQHHHRKSVEHTIRHAQLFKGVADRRPLVLREPKLRLLEQCLVHGLVQQQASSTAQPAAAAAGAVILPRRSLQERLQRVHRKWDPVLTTADTTCPDFRSLVSECANLSLASCEPSAIGDSQQYRATQPRRRKHHLSSSSPDGGAPASRPCRSRSEEHLFPAASCSQQAASNASTAASSGDAASPADGDCDVTIDELASYFETFVHIPKKMSSMAEMMYI